MKKPAIVDRVIEACCNSVASVLLIFILVALFVEVIARYFFSISHPWVIDVSAWCMVWITYLMIGLVEKGREHVRIDIIPTKIPERYQPWLLTFFDIVSLLFCVLLGWGGIKYVQTQKAIALVLPSMQVQLWIFQLCIPLGAILLAFFSIRNLITDIRSLSKRGGEEA